MKKIIIGLVLGIVLGASGSVFASGFNSIVTKVTPLTPAEQIAKGNVFNIYTGERLVAPLGSSVQIDPVEARFRALEDRVTKLEANKK